MDWTFRTPQKYIHSPDALRLFRECSTYKHLLDFIIQISVSLKGRPTDSRQVADASEGVQRLVHLLDVATKWIDEIPPVGGGLTRFGNRSFQAWCDRLQAKAHEILRPILGAIPRQPDPAANQNVDSSTTAFALEDLQIVTTPVSYEKAIDELAVYLCSSFGDRTRIDYGSGHELNFLCFLYCLMRLRVFILADFVDLGIVVFPKYLALMRKLQQTYSLEPAGSRGVWGLDDFHFLPFLFGAAQLIGQSEIKPSQVTSPTVARMYANEYLYLDSIKWIFETKVGVPFGECSPILNDITSVALWSKIHTGLIKMYQAEVLGQFPVMQHFLCGSMLPPPLLDEPAPSKGPG